MMKRLLAISLLLFIAPGFSFGQTEVKMDSGLKKKLNTFFSNFSEANVGGFRLGGLSDSLLLDFALRHNYLNRFQSLKVRKEEMSVEVSVDQVDKTTEKYFGKKVSKHEKPVYVVPISDGDAFFFSQIDRLFKLEKGFFRAEGSIFTTGSGGVPDVHANPEVWKKNKEEVELVSRFSATIKSEEDRYILIDYSVTPIGSSEDSQGNKGN